MKHKTLATRGLETRKYTGMKLTNEREKLYTKTTNDTENEKTIK